MAISMSMAMATGQACDGGKLLTMIWTNEKRRLGDLIPWDKNPRKISPDKAARLLESWGEFDQVDTIAIGPGNELYNGHQRLAVLLAHKGEDFPIDVRVSSRPLTEKERERLVVLLHRGATGDWDFEELGGWDFGELVDWGFSEDELVQVPAPDFLPVKIEEQPRLDKVDNGAVTCPECGNVFTP